MSVGREVKALGLLTGRGRQTTLLRLCDASRLIGAFSASLHALPDETLGSLTHALGGNAKLLRIIDVRSGPPMMLEVSTPTLREKWDVENVEALVHNVNDLYRDDHTVKVAVVLGEWNDMLQVWCVEKSVLPKLFARRLIDDARNARAVRALLEPHSR